MKTIKIIELLNKIANGETPPRKIKWGDVYVYSDKIQDYRIEDDDDYDYLLESVSVNQKCLIEEIEILDDDDKKIERLPILFYDEENGKLNNAEIFIMQNENRMIRKINEIIDYINNNHIPRID